MVTCTTVLNAGKTTNILRCKQNHIRGNVRRATEASKIPTIRGHDDHATELGDAPKSSVAVSLLFIYFSSDSVIAVVLLVSAQIATSTEHTFAI